MLPARRQVPVPAFAPAFAPVLRSLLACLLGCLVLAGCAPVAQPAEAPTVPPSSVARAREQLAGLQVRAWNSMRGYSRARFPHWAERPDGCNTRAAVLRRDATSVRGDRPCPVRSGRWVSPYDGAEHTAAGDLDVDHVVPLANAWRSGANRWTDKRREAFANDLRHPELVAVTASVNRSKGDQGPEAWRPPVRGYWCRYAHDWITVKAAYRLSVTRTERAALTDMLDQCGRN